MIILIGVSLLVSCGKIVSVDKEFEGHTKTTDQFYDMSYDEVKDSYRVLWSSMEVNEGRNYSLKEHVRKIKSFKRRYQKIEKATNVPWYIVGIIHGMESNYNFKTHLHNGDSLKRQTVNVPAGRPLGKSGPFSWEESAVDALKMKNYHKIGFWKDITRVGYVFERYNGFGYRYRGINSPYLWSFTKHYTKGKYRYDGLYDSNYVSLQAGAMAILKYGSEEGAFDFEDLGAFIGKTCGVKSIKDESIRLRDEPHPRANILIELLDIDIVRVESVHHDGNWFGVAIEVEDEIYGEDVDNPAYIWKDQLNCEIDL